jgi:ABC-type sugar transport system substrate-binding protein
VNRREVVKLTAAALGAAAASGLARGTTRAVAAVPRKKGRVANIIVIANEYDTVLSRAAKQTGKVLQLSGYSETDIESDPVRSARTAASYAGRGFNMILVGGADGSELRPTEEACAKAKAYHSQMWAAGPWYMPVDVSQYYSAFWDLHDPPNTYKATKVMLQELSRRLGNKEGRAFHISGQVGGSLYYLRRKGVLQAFAEFPNIKLLGELPGFWGAVQAKKATEDLVGRHGKPDAIASSNDGMLTGILAAVEGLGMKPGEDVLLSGQDGNPDIMEAIRDGRVVSTTFHGPFTFAVQPITRMFDLLNGVDSFSPVERQMFVDGIVVTKNNVGGFFTRYYGSKDTLPFDPRKISRLLHPKDWDPQIQLTPIDIEEYFKTAGVKKPKGYRLPAAYTAAKRRGDFAKITALYKKHYRTKLDDFTFRGVRARV